MLVSKKSHFYLLVCFVTIVLVGVLSSCSKGDKAEEAMVQKISADSVKLSVDAIQNLKLGKVVQGDFPEQLSLMGKISVPEDRTVVVPARVGGRVDAVFVSSGEVVGKEQSMASLFSADFVIAREEYVQALKQVEGSPDSSDAKRLLELSRKKLNALGMSDVDIRNLGVIREAKGENLMVRAPRGGAVLDKKIIVGNMVNQGDTLFTLGDLSKVWFAGDIYVEDLRKVRKNQEVVIDTLEGQPPIHGKVSFISPVVDPNTRTIKIRALMDNPGSQLRADMYVKGNLILSRRTALVAPKSALVRLRDVVFCFKRMPGNIFQRVPLTIEAESSDSVAVSEGLKDGDEVVTEGALLLDAALTGDGS